VPSENVTVAFLKAIEPFAWTSMRLYGRGIE